MSKNAPAKNQKRSAVKSGKRPKVFMPLLLTGAGAAIAVLLYTFIPGQSAEATEITVYKSPSCGCCGKWVDHLEDSGFVVTVKNRKDMSSVKREFAVQHRHQSCHTAMVDGYVIEGHVPAVDIKSLLQDKPAIQGLAVPGMPMGSPGMEGSRKDRYAVLAVDKQGRDTVFSRY